MQTGIFFVRLKSNIPADEQGEVLSGRVERLQEAFDRNQAYPVLAVHFREENRLKQTFYHMPMKSGELAWFSSEYFVFAQS